MPRFFFNLCECLRELAQIYNQIHAEEPNWTWNEQQKNWYKIIEVFEFSRIITLSTTIKINIHFRW